MLRDHLIDDNLILILLIQVRIYGPWTVLVGTTIPRSLWVFVGYPEGEFMLNRGISNDFKEVFKREKVVSFNRELTKLMEGSHD